MLAGLLGAASTLGVAIQPVGYFLQTDKLGDCLAHTRLEFVAFVGLAATLAA